MRQRWFGSCLVLASLGSVAWSAPPTYLGVGDVAAAGNTELRILAATGSDSAGYSIPSSTPTTALWDPSHPDDFVIGGGSAAATGGYLVRSSFVGSGQVVSSALSPAGSFGKPVQLSWDQTGTGVIVVSTFGQVHRVDATTGAVTNVTSGAQPWGTTLNAGAMDRVTGDIYVGTVAGDVWRIAPGASGGNLFLSGLGSIQKILIDTNGAGHALYVASSQSFRRVTLGGTPVVEPYFGTFGTPAAPGTVVSADFDQHGDFIVATNSSKAYRLANPASIPVTGVAAVYFGQYSFPTAAGFVSDVTVVGTSSAPFRLTLKSVPILGAEMSVENVPQPVGFGFVFLSASTFLPVGTGPFFGITPDILTITILGLTPTPGGIVSYVTTPPTPVTVPQFGMLPYFGQTWDGVAVAFAPNAQFLGRSNVVRVTWQ